MDSRHFSSRRSRTTADFVFDRHTSKGGVEAPLQHVISHPTSNAEWNETGSPPDPSLKGKIETSDSDRGYKRRDSFAYYSSPDFRITQLQLPLQKKRERKGDMAKFMGLRRPMRMREAFTHAKTGSNKLLSDDTSVSTRQSRVSVEMHDSVIFDCFEQMLLECDGEDSSTEADSEEDETSEKAQVEFSNSSKELNVSIIIGSEIILKDQEAVPSSMRISTYPDELEEKEDAS